MITPLSFYQHLPGKIYPAAFHIGSFGVGWYALMYIAAFLTVYLLLLYRIKNKEFPKGLQVTGCRLRDMVEDFIFYSFLGVVIGGRLGYVIFYNLPYYVNNFWEAILPIQAMGSGFQVTGFYGMSYHGGLLGVLLATWFFCRKNKIHPPTKRLDESSKNNIPAASLGESSFGEGVKFLRWADFVVPAVPAGFFFGRLGNFLNGELYGRITNASWGMYFPAGGEMLRHPSQLYEAFFEGLVLFVILWSVRNGLKYKGKTLHVPCFMLYVFLYGLFRFFLEFFRQPDPQLGFVIKLAGNGLTLGQMLSLGMIIFSVFLILYPVRNKNKKS